MSNKAKRNASLLLAILGVIILIGLALSGKLYGIQHDVWQYIAAPLWIAFFGIMYRNFSQAVKEDEKFGPIK